MRQPLTPEQIEDAQRLKTYWEKWKKQRIEAGERATQEVASEFLGFNQSSLSQYINGKIPLNIDAASKFASLIGCTVSDFSPSLTKQVEQYAAAAAPESAFPFAGKASRVSVGATGADVIPVKAVKLHLQAGFPGFEVDQDFEDGGTIDVPRQFIEERDLVPQCLLAIRVKGESMEPLLFDGDSVVINIADTKWVDQGVFALNFNGQSIIKRLSYEDKDWWMVSENTKFRRQRCSLGETIVIGRVVWRPASWRM